MRVQFLFSSVDNGVHRCNRAALRKVKDYLVINQLRSDQDPDFQQEPHTYSFAERGLSRSRNKALARCEGDIAFLCDEDLDFVESPGEIVADAYRRHPAADLIIFATKTPHGRVISARRTSPPVLTTVRTLLSTRSCMVSLRRRSVLEAGVRFDERFGLGTTFPTGAENIFVFDCKRAGLNIVLDPSVVTIHPLESSGNQFGDESVVRAKGAVLARIFPRTHLFYLLVYCVTQRTLYRDHCSMIRFLTLMLQGRAEFKRLHG